MTPTPVPPTFDLDDEVELGPPSAVVKLGGRTWHILNKDDLPWGLTSENFLQRGEDGSLTMGGVVSDFVKLFVFPEEVDQLLALLSDPKSKIRRGHIDRFLEVVAQALFGRPTERAEPSSSGAPATPRSSKANSSSEVAPRKRSRPSPPTRPSPSRTRSSSSKPARQTAS